MENKKQTKTPQELDNYLKDLLHFIAKSTQAFDMGFDGEVQRMAVAIRAIVDDPDGTGSLLKKLGIDIEFYDNCPEYDAKLALPMSGIALFAPTNKDKNRYVPRLGRNPGVQLKKVSFEQWWNKHVIIDEGQGVRITRKDIVYRVSNTTPPTSARPMLNEEFNKLIKENPIGWVDDNAGLKKAPVQLAAMELASTRYIAFELLLTFEEQRPHYFEGFYPEPNPNLH